jgi:hypothetical protein
MRQIAVRVVLSNVGHRIDPEEVFSFIESNATGIEIYERAPPPPGAIRAAAIDWMLVLMAVQSAASLANLFWIAYDRFIAPKKSDSDNLGIYLVVMKDNGTTDQFWLGTTHKNRDAFIKEFTHKIETIRHTDVAGESTEHVIEEIGMKSLWTLRKPRPGKGSEGRKGSKTGRSARPAAARPSVRPKHGGRRRAKHTR